MLHCQWTRKHNLCSLNTNSARDELSPWRIGVRNCCSNISFLTLWLQAGVIHGELHCQSARKHIPQRWGAHLRVWCREPGTRAGFPLLSVLPRGNSSELCWCQGFLPYTQDGSHSSGWVWQGVHVLQLSYLFLVCMFANYKSGIFISLIYCFLDLFVALHSFSCNFNFSFACFLVHPKTIVFGRTSVLLWFISFFFPCVISELRRPIGAKFCTMLSAAFNFIIPVQNFGGASQKNF